MAGTAEAIRGIDARAPEAAVSAPLETLRILVDGFTRLENLPKKGAFDAVADLLLDAILGSDHDLLDAAVDALREAEVAYRRATRGRDDLGVPLARVQTLLTLATGARDRVPAADDFALVAPGSRAHQVLQLVRLRHTVGAKDIAAELGLASAQLSRITADLGRRRLVARVKAGREVYFDITPHGEDVLGDIAARRHKARRSRVRPVPPRDATPVLYGSGEQAFELRATAIRAAIERSGRPAERSRALFAALAAKRPDVITDRVMVWGRLIQAARPERIELRLAGPDTPDATNARLTWDILQNLGEPAGKAGAAWPGPAPLWDGWAVVHGRRGRHEVVFLEAKSTVQELKSKPVNVGRNYDKAAWTEVLEGTGRYLHAREAWHAWPDYADAATRLAFIHQLKQLGIPAWWMNLYFVDPKRLLSNELPATSAVWEAQIKAVRGGLTIKDGHPLSDFIRHEMVLVPEDGVRLALTA